VDSNGERRFDITGVVVECCGPHPEDALIANIFSGVDFPPALVDITSTLGIGTFVRVEGTIAMQMSSIVYTAEKVTILKSGPMLTVKGTVLKHEAETLILVEDEENIDKGTEYSILVSFNLTDHNNSDFEPGTRLEVKIVQFDFGGAFPGSYFLLGYKSLK
jgi:hypothetical protein